MLFNYKTLTEQLTDYLSENYPSITTHTDIFEHAFLRFLGYQSVPEKCQFEDNLERNSLSIYLKTPYKVTNSKFVDDLRVYIAGKFSAIKIEEIDPNSNQGFSIHLIIPYTWIKDYIPELFQSIKSLLSDPLKMDFYRYSDIHARKVKDDLSIIYIESLIRKKLLQYPYLNVEDVWSAIIQKNMTEATKVTFLEKQVAVDIDNFPKILLVYEENKKTNTLAITRNQIVINLLEEGALDQFLIGDTATYEFISPIGINDFIKKKYGHVFFINSKGHYEIDLGYHGYAIEILKKYGIKELSSYQPTEAPYQSQIYCYDKQNYLKALLALKEIKGKACVDERWHQLIYYINHQMWEKLTTELKFLLNLKAETRIEIDYANLLIRLYQHAKDNLQEGLQEHTLEIIEEVCMWLTSKVQLQNDILKKIYAILFELTLLRMNQLEDSDEAKSIHWKEKLFTFAQKAGLEESNFYLAEIAGLKFGNTFSLNVNDNPLAVLIELAKKNKAISEENARLKAEIAMLKPKNSLQESTVANFHVNTASHFTLRK